MSVRNSESLIHSLVKLPKETEWIEFKHNNDSQEDIGKYISALSNSAILAGEQKAYLVFGVKNDTHEIVGTTVRLADKVVGNEGFLHWLSKMITPALHIEHNAASIDGKHVEFLCVDPAYKQPVRFRERGYIRIDTSIHPLTDSPGKEEALWQAVSRFSYERAVARAQVGEQEIYDRLYIRDLVNQLSQGRLHGNLLEYLIQEGLIVPNLEFGFDVRNLLVLIAARDFQIWSGFERKGVRLIVFTDSTKLHSVKDIWGRRGYFIAFEKVLSEIMEAIPHREELRHGIRRTVYDIPEVAIREVLANAIIHQDFIETDRGPNVEIFPDRIVITNPGEPLVKPDRFVDTPSKSRNNLLADIMRRFGVCEERGSGIDRAFIAIEKAGLPPPLVRVVERNTVVTIFGPRQFAALTKDERLRACYWHACLCVERNEFMSNKSLRSRFKLNDKQYPQVSEVIKEAQENGLIKPLREDQGNRMARYVPYWY